MLNTLYSKTPEGECAYAPEPVSFLSILGDSGSQMVQHHFGGFKYKVRIISITKMIHLENSSDLERAPGARSIAAEFSKCIILVVELLRCENTGFHIHAAPFGTRSPLAQQAWSASELFDRVKKLGQLWLHQLCIISITIAVTTKNSYRIRTGGGARSSNPMSFWW